MSLKACHYLIGPHFTVANVHVALSNLRNSHVALSMLGVKGHRNGRLLDTLRPKIHLRSRKKVKFKYPFRNMQKFLRSPLSRGITIWD